VHFFGMYTYYIWCGLQMHMRYLCVMYVCIAFDLSTYMHTWLRRNVCLHYVWCELCMYVQHLKEMGINTHCIYRVYWLHFMSVLIYIHDCNVMCVYRFEFRVYIHRVKVMCVYMKLNVNYLYTYVITTSCTSVLHLMSVTHIHTSFQWRHVYMTIHVICIYTLLTDQHFNVIKCYDMIWCNTHLCTRDA